MPRGTRWQDAIHHVDAQSDVVGDLFGAADAHQISRTVFREEFGDDARHFAGHRVRLTDGEAADGVAGKVDFEKLLCALAAEVGERGALHDAELPLGQAGAGCGGAVLRCLSQEIFASAAGPLRCALHCRFGDVARGGRLDALVEHHGDVGTERELNLGSFLWSEQMLRAIEMRAEAHAFVGDFAKLGKAEDLKAAGIGEDRAGPGHEFVQAAEFADQLVTRAQI